VFRLAFGTQYGLDDPLAFAPGSEMVRSRLDAPHTRSFAATMDGELVGSAFLSRWGSLAVFGPLTVAPEAWGLGVGSRLLDACLELADDWGVSVGLFTLPDSTKHLHLYRKHGFWPGALTALTEKSVAPNGGAVETLGDLDASARAAAIEECRAVIEALAGPDTGDVVMSQSDGRVAAFALCHVGDRSEAVTGSCYVKFAAVRPGPEGVPLLDGLLDACEAFAAARGAVRLEVGVSLGRRSAAELLAARGHRTFRHGVAMQRPLADPAAMPEQLLLDDWR
jgi:GNAT superfamily N-acetyltransferase